MAGNARPFMDFLREHGRGITHEMLTDKLQELVAAVIEAEKGGKMVFTIAIKPMGKKDTGAFEVTAGVDVKMPKVEPEMSVFYATPENNLVRLDPRQQTMELREITPASAHRGIA